MVTLVEEDGSGLPDSNSYASVSYADTYNENRGNAYWDALDDDVKASCLIKATDYIDKRFTRNFRGFRMQKDQALAWPRLAAYDDDRYALTEIPEKLKKATAEYALRAAVYNVLAPDPIRPTPSQDMSSDTDPNASPEIIAGPVRSKKVVVGPVEKTVTYDTPAQYRRGAAGGADSRRVESTLVNDWYIPMYPEADLLIENLVDSNVSVSLERA